MIRFITTKRLRELEYTKSLTEELTAELRLKDSLNRALQRQVHQLVAMSEKPARDLGAESRKRNAEQLVADSQKARRDAEEDIPSTFPGLWSLGPAVKAQTLAAQVVDSILTASPKKD